MQMTPKEDEVKALQAYTGPVNELTPPEQFLLTLSKVPRLLDKINLLILIKQFEVSLASLSMTFSFSTYYRPRL